MSSGITTQSRGSRGVSQTALQKVGRQADERTPQRSLMAFSSLEEAFPKADPGLTPFGSNILIQMRTPRTKTEGGIIIPDEARETDHWNTQVGKLVAVGPMAFHNRDTGLPWPEGAWAEIGEYVRVPKYGGDRWWVDAEGPDKKALFVVFTDLDLIGRVPESKVLRMVAYIL